jgi:hypothetical protein
MATIVNARDVLLQAAVPRMVNLTTPFAQVNGFRNSRFRKHKIWDPDPFLTSWVESWQNYTTNPTVNRLSIGGDLTEWYGILPPITTATAAYAAFGQDPEEGWQPHTYYVLSFETRAFFGPPGTQFYLTWGNSGDLFTSATLIKEENPVITTSWQTYVAYFKFDAITLTSGYTSPHLQIRIPTVAGTPYILVRNAMIIKGTTKIDFVPALDEIQGLEVDSGNMIPDAVNDIFAATNDGGAIGFNTGTYTTVASLTYDAAQSCVIICSVSGSLTTTQPASPGTVLVDNPAWYFEVGGTAGNVVTVPGGSAALPYDVTLSGSDNFAVTPTGTITISLKVKAQSTKYQAWTDNVKMLVEVRKR